MLSPALLEKTKPIFYPETDGLPMSDNTKQFRWIVTFADNLQALFHDRPDVFVCGNQFWYPVEGSPEECVSPDVYVVFGRPKGDRPSYQQWMEANVPMTVIFEILSPGNDSMEMTDKFTFYEEHGVEEYYLYDPDKNRLQGYCRRGEFLRRVHPINGFVSPRLNIRFELAWPELVVRYPDGRPFQTFVALEEERKQEQQRANQAVQRAEGAEQRMARLSELSGKLLRQKATPEEIEELQRLAKPAP